MTISQGFIKHLVKWRFRRRSGQDIAETFEKLRLKGSLFAVARIIVFHDWKETAAGHVAKFSR
jgi:hypothetical protein